MRSGPPVAEERGEGELHEHNDGGAKWARLLGGPRNEERKVGAGALVCYMSEPGRARVDWADGGLRPEGKREERNRFEFCYGIFEVILNLKFKF